VKKKLQNAYAMTEYGDAKRALERLHLNYAHQTAPTHPTRELESWRCTVFLSAASV
jgi:hypothetical protein